MNKYLIIEAAILRAADALTTARLGLSDGRIEMEDCVDVFNTVKEVVRQLEVIAAIGPCKMGEARVEELKAAFNAIKLG